MPPEQQYLNWHPKFKTYHINEKDLLLSSESRYLVLTENIFPGIQRIDGKTSTQEITDAFDDIQQGATFFYRINQLEQQGLLIKVNTIDLPEYHRRQSTNINPLWKNQQTAIINLSSANQQQLAAWCDLIEHTAHNKKSVLTYFLLDDFLDPRITAAVKQTQNYCLVKITGEKIWLSPVSTPQWPLPWSKLQHQLWQNQPVRKLVSRLYPQQDHSTPFLIDHPLTAENLCRLKSLLEKQLTAKQQQLCLMDLATNNPEYHPVNPHYSVDGDFSTQITSPLELENCLSRFNKDGGSRHINQQQTLTNLSPLISPVTGIITHVEELTTTKDKTLKTYRSAFFKTPQRSKNNTLPNEHFVQTCMGKGVSPLQSQVSAICEAIERYAALYQGDEPLLLSRQSTLTGRSVDFQQLRPYSQTQYANFTDPKHPDSTLKQAAKPYQDSAIHWLPAWSLSQQEPVYVPLSACCSHIPFNDEQFGHWHSNGCAAGNTIEEAILQALYELIERDATGIWWYNQTKRPAFDLKRLSENLLNKLNETLAVSHKFWLLDLTTDIGVPVMVAVGQDHHSQGYTLGMGCHLQPELAAQRALTELYQLVSINDQNNTPASLDAVVGGAYLHPQPQQAQESQQALTSIAPFTAPQQDIKDDILSIVERLNGLGYETLALNYSRSHIPIKTAKVFVPGLCHIWPQLANERLYRIPVQLGWLKEAKTEATINQQGLYI